MNKALLSAASFIVAMTALSVSTVGDTNTCGEINGWTAPVTVFVTMLIPTVLAYFAGRGKRLKASRRAIYLKRIGLQP